MTALIPLIHHPDEGAEHEIAERCRILETWNRETDPAVSVARARVKPGITTRLHRLIAITERYFILAGSGLVEVGRVPPRLVVPGDLVYIPPGCTQRIGNPGPDDLVFLAICTPRFQPEAYEAVGLED